MKRFLFGILLGTLLGGSAVKASFYDIDDVMTKLKDIDDVMMKLDDIERDALTTIDLMVYLPECQ